MFLSMSIGQLTLRLNQLPRELRSNSIKYKLCMNKSIKYETLNNSQKIEIEEDIEKDFNHALIGIKQLPTIARSGVYLSYNYYRELLNKIKLLDTDRLKQERIRVSNFKKFIILLSTYINPI